MDVSMFMDHSFQNTEEQHRSSGQSLMEKKRQESQPCIWKKGLDTGDMIDKAEVVLDKKETAGSLHDKLMVLGANLLLETLKKLEDGTAVREKQK